MDVREAANKITVLQAANPASLAALMPYALIKRFKKGQHLFLDKDNVQNVYFLAKGTVSLYKLSSNHEKKVIFIYGAGAMLNETVFDSKPESINCEFLSNSDILCFDKNRFLFVCEQDFELTKAVMNSMSLKLRKLYHQMKNTANTVRGDKRIAAKLWKLSRDHGVPCKEGTMIGFNMTITYLAELIGSKRETVSRQLKILTGQNLVIVDKNRFIVPDRDKLLIFFNQP